MTTLKERIADVAFWDGFICLSCGFAEYDEGEVSSGDVCPRCDDPAFVRATTVKGVIARSNDEEGACDD